MRLATPLLAALLMGCVGERPEFVSDHPPIVPGSPVAGAAEGTLDLPVGVPLSAFSSRCGCLGGTSRVDDRDSAYTTAFVESAGVHIRPVIKTIWLENGDDHLVFIKVDLAYSFDGLVSGVEDTLMAETGLDLRGKVTISTSHTHNSYGTFSDAVAFYLGHDKFNKEIFLRTVEQLSDVSLEAYESREGAAIGVGWAKDWDPDNRVYRSRRGENNELQIFDDIPAGDWKNPYLTMLRVDTVAGDPIAVAFGFGSHPYVLGEWNPLVTADYTQVMESAVEEQFDGEVVALHFQTGAGDASVAGTDEQYAKMETVAEYAVGSIMDLWEATPTSSDPIRMETASRQIALDPATMRVTRGGEVDWYYLPYDEDYNPDNEIFGEDGEILSPIDEFTTNTGAVFCGTGDIQLPSGSLNADVPPFSTCLTVDLMSRLVLAFFDLTEEEVALPLADTTNTNTTASRIGPLPTLYPDGTTETADLLMGFFPGEPTSMFAEMWRQRVHNELGYFMPWIIGYSQDHEGYLLIPEDWLAGGYEADIVVWGPLSAEHIMEQVIGYAGTVLSTDVHEPPNPFMLKPTYPEKDLPTLQPDLTLDAGTLLTVAPEYFWIPQEFALNLMIPAEVPRVQGQIQVAWSGGDPGVDNPNVTVERLVDGTWQAHTMRSGRPVTEDGHDIILAHTPDPLYPAEFDQTHYWWAVWQTVDHFHDRAGLPLGTYRLKVEGHRYVGGNETWPWDKEPYELTSDEFEIVPADIEVAWDGVTLSAWLQAPVDGFRLIDTAGYSKGANPLPIGTVTITFETPTGDVGESVELGVATSGTSVLDVVVPVDATSITVVDVYGNTGTVELVIP